MRALAWNLRTWPTMPRKRHKWKSREAESTDASERGGLPCSSDEAG
jgi:hypothetical protein